MNPEQFCYWLQGFTELTPGIPPTPEQWKAIGEHLSTVFMKVTPAVIPPGRLSDILTRQTPAKDQRLIGWPTEPKIIC